MTPAEPDTRTSQCGMMHRRRSFSVMQLALVLVPSAAFGCQQKMAEQPYYRPYEPETSGIFQDGRSARPLEAGVVHRGQRLDYDPQVTGLTTDEWSRVWRQANPNAKLDLAGPIDQAAREAAVAAPRYDQRVAGQPKVYVEEFPFEITDTDLLRGKDRYTAYCAMCHGPLGNGKGKIWERGYLKPTSYHTEKVDSAEPVEKNDVEAGIPLGFSRGYWRWGIGIPLREVPPGYIYEVISRGYGAMGDYAAQIKPEDRWRIVAYIRVLQYSRHAELPKKAEGGK